VFIKRMEGESRVEKKDEAIRNDVPNLTWEHRKKRRLTDTRTEKITDMLVQNPTPTMGVQTHSREMVPKLDDIRASEGTVAEGQEKKKFQRRRKGLGQKFTEPESSYHGDPDRE